MNYACISYETGAEHVGIFHKFGDLIVIRIRRFSPPRNPILGECSRNHKLKFLQSLYFQPTSSFDN